VLCGVAGGALHVLDALRGNRSSDFGPVWYAARAILRGTDPYTHIGPGLAFPWEWPFVYPLTAGVLAVPFAPLSEIAAGTLFAALGAACLAWALMRYGYGPLFGFFAYPMREAIFAAQWSPVFTASLAIPALSLLYAAKPTLGAALFVARPRWWPIVGGVVLALVAYAVQPTWVADWCAALARHRAQTAPDEPFRSIVTYPGGVVALLCLLRWRRPEARLVAALACVPLTTSSYEAVPLLLVPVTFWESATLVALSYLQEHAAMWFVTAPWTPVEYAAAHGVPMVLGLYLPCVVMVLRRPNVGAVPAWLERRITAWPCG
jgi:hypothetical protein